MLTNKSVVVLIKNPEYAMSETKTRTSLNAFDSKTKTNLEYDNTTDYRAKERYTSLMFFQITWIKILKGHFA